MSSPSSDVDWKMFHGVAAAVPKHLLPYVTSPVRGTEGQSHVGLCMHELGSYTAIRISPETNAESLRLVSYAHVYGYGSLAGL